MLRNYIIIAFRNILRSKVYSSINILGLSLGVACCLLLALYVQDEMSFDKHHKNLDRIYRVLSHFEGGSLGSDKTFTTASPPIAMAVQAEVAEVAKAARLLNPPGVSQSLIKYEDNVFYEKNGFIADSTVFDIFTYEFIEGNSKKALKEANTVVINDKLAHKLFGDTPALDKTINIDNVDFKITGVVKDNERSHIHPNFFTSMLSNGWAEYLRSADAMNAWAGNNFVPTYVMLNPQADKKEAEAKINAVLQKYGAENMKAMGMKKTLLLEPVEDIYLKSSADRSPRITYIYVIVSIAVFILLIACINFMNLSTARATKRANEIGVRKVMGAFRSSLIGQLLGEAMVIVIFSILLSLIFVQTTLPFFNQLTGKNISFTSDNLIYFLAALCIITLVTGLLAGSYPAFYLSSFQPAQVLKGKFAMSNASGWLRRGLVVFQFVIAITLMCGMVIISQQLKYMEQSDLGFDAEAKIVLPLRTETSHKNYEALRAELENNSAIKSVSGTGYSPGNYIFSDMSFYKDGGSMDEAVNIARNPIDFGYMEEMGIKLLAGRTFTESRELDSKGKIIVNQTVVKEFGFTEENAVGQNLHFDYDGNKYNFEIIGVMEDYHQNSLKEKIRPTLFELAPRSAFIDFVIINTSTQNFNQTISGIEQTWKKLINDTPFEYSFLDQDIQKQYEEDRKVGSIINSFAAIALLISCLGLYGLSTFMAERRFKEIGVRKVMGASVNQIVGLMSKEFVKLVVAAFIIAVPLAWYAMNQWLKGFAYKISVNASVFIYAGLAALLIALLTVSFESIKAASTNPVKSLRNE